MTKNHEAKNGVLKFTLGFEIEKEREREKTVSMKNPFDSQKFTAINSMVSINGTYLQGSR